MTLNDSKAEEKHEKIRELIDKDVSIITTLTTFTDDEKKILYNILLLKKKATETTLAVENHKEPNSNSWGKTVEQAKIWNGEKYEDKDMVMQTNPDNDIKKHVAWVPDNLIGEQLFSENALDRLDLRDKLPDNLDFIKSMIALEPWTTDKEKYESFFNTYIKHRLPGHCTKNDDVRAIGYEMYCWLGDKTIACFDENHLGWIANPSDYFCTVCFLKK